MSKKGPTHTPPPEFKIKERYGYETLRRQQNIEPRNPTLSDKEIEYIKTKRRKRERERQRRWQLFWWSCAAAACCVYWLWWLWPTAEPVKWSAFG